MEIMHATAEQRKQTGAWFHALRERIMERFEALEQRLPLPGMESLQAGQFTRTDWLRSDHHDNGPDAHQGGGQMGLMYGRLFEKVGVNVSTVYGRFPNTIADELPGDDGSGAFWASGLSLVAHMQSPHVPNIHMNTRFISTAGKCWFGGGIDLNPVIRYQNDEVLFHQRLEQLCEQHFPGSYPGFKRACDDYFMIPHRKVARGAGGIFFDRINHDDWSCDLGFIKAVGECFLELFPHMVERRAMMPWTSDQREQQLAWRGRYAEFNLLYDRGTKFGLMTGASPQAVLMSLPPLASWKAI
ncbi:MAG: oxygen-dependent coproporphyrinogen oxidase [Pseudomonadota bacterium]